MFSTILDLSFLVIVFVLQIGKNKTFLAKKGKKIGVGLFLFVLVNIALTNPSRVNFTSSFASFRFNL